jgi:hypothetical protein
MSRLSKQFVYGGIYLVLVGLLGLGVAGLVRPASSCVDARQNGAELGVDCGPVCGNFCVPSDLSPITVSEEPRVFHPAPGTVASYAKIENANQEFGAKSFDYTFTFYDTGGTKLGMKAGRSYIYAGEIKQLVAIADLKGAATAIRAEVKIDRPEWNPNDDFPRPNIALQDRAARADAQGLHAEGKFVNRDASALVAADAVAIFHNHAGSPLGVSETALAGFRPGESRMFTILHPPILGVDPERTQFFIYGKRP